jgi:hypothetical protein
MVAISTGDLHPICIVPMPGTHKTRRGNPYQPFIFDDFPELQPKPCDRRPPPLVVVHALIVLLKSRNFAPRLSSEQD